MLKGSDKRSADYPIDKLFLDRWSPRAMSGEEIPEQAFLSLLEAARWAPSSYNAQPWRMLYARRNSPSWPLFFELLIDFNKGWCKNAAALVVFVSKKTAHNGQPSVTHSFDTGAAWASFALQGWLKGYVVHGMQGFDYEGTREVLKIPEDFRVEMMAAVGEPAPTDVLSRQLQERESPSDRRQLSETVCEGLFRLS